MSSIKSLLATASSLFPSNNKNQPSQLRGMISILIGIILLSLGIALLTSIFSFRSLQTLDIAKADRQAGFARFVSRQLSNISGGHIASVESWKTSLELIHSVNLFSSEFSTRLSQLNAGESPSFVELAEIALTISEKINYLSMEIQRSAILRRLVNPDLRERISEVSKIASESVPIISSLAQEKHNTLILFQNSDELRATGGFIGSYALLHLQNGSLDEIVVEDIYDADGQFTGYIEPPAGVNEYLSANNGLRLPNANWQADFADSAQQILRFFALSDRGEIDTVISVNLNLAKTLLEITGPIHLPDNESDLSSENVSSLLRTERGDFFAGSRAKTQLLSQAVTGLKLALSNLSKEKQLLAMKEIANHIKDRDILLFFVKPELQEHATSLGITGELPVIENEDTLFVYPVESNVGINKVNPYISRKVVVAQAEKLTEVGITFSHLATDQPGYINYQRLIVSPDAEIVSINVDEDELQSWDEEVIKTHSGNKFKQIGFLVPVPPGTEVRIRVAIRGTNPPENLLIRKQPGVTPIPLTVISDDQTKQILLINDHLISLSPG